MATAAQVQRIDPDQALARARDGDPEAFGVLVRRHQSMVFSLALHTLGSRAAAEDLAQEVFLELYRAAPRLASPAHVVSWLRRVTSHRCIDQLRKVRRRSELPLDTVPDGAPMRPLRDPFLGERLQELVARLPARPRLVVVLRYQEELEPSEIAEALDMPVNTVKSHLRRSLEQLRAGMAEDRR